MLVLHDGNRFITVYITDKHSDEEDVLVYLVTSEGGEESAVVLKPDAKRLEEDEGDNGTVVISFAPELESHNSIVEHPSTGDNVEGLLFMQSDGEIGVRDLGKRQGNTTISLDFSRTSRGNHVFGAPEFIAQTVQHAQTDPANTAPKNIDMDRQITANKDAWGYRARA